MNLSMIQILVDAILLMNALVIDHAFQVGVREHPTVRIKYRTVVKTNLLILMAQEDAHKAQTAKVIDTALIKAIALVSQIALLIKPALSTRIQTLEEKADATKIQNVEELDIALTMDTAMEMTYAEFQAVKYSFPYNKAYNIIPKEKDFYCFLNNYLIVNRTFRFSSEQ